MLFFAPCRAEIYCCAGGVQECPIYGSRLVSGPNDPNWTAWYALKSDGVTLYRIQENPKGTAPPMTGLFMIESILMILWIFSEAVFSFPSNKREKEK